MLLLLLLFLLTTSATSTELRGQRSPTSGFIKLLFSDCSSQRDSSDTNGKVTEVDLVPGSPLVLTHQIKLVPSGPGSGSCGCDLSVLRQRVETLEKEVTELKDRCGAEESKGGACPDECSDQGRCVDGRCVCFTGFTGDDCSQSDCPNDCSSRGRCVDGRCVCGRGFTGDDCSQSDYPNDCTSRGRCVDGRCVCGRGFTGDDCSQSDYPNDCTSRGRCVDGRCVCGRGFTGDDCSQSDCPSDCTSRGRCVDGRCVCDDGFTGTDCSQSTCLSDCSANGQCVDGRCVCDDGFTGTDCSQSTCLSDCSANGQCVDGRCVCDDGFTGTDCSQSTCLSDCSANGQCVDGRCVCDDGFTGTDCSQSTCLSDCSANGQCVDGRCVCDDGFTGTDCSQSTCLSDCSANGQCVDGRCVCDDGFTGTDCSQSTCLSDCSANGQCVDGRCVCDDGFTGSDCSQCETGRGGVNCGQLLVGVAQLSTEDVTDSSVTLLWASPSFHYDVYYITFSSQKESEQQVLVRVDGRQTSFTQTGLAPGQRYGVSVVGEVGGQRGLESTAHFLTRLAAPSNLRVVKTTSSSAVVQWEESPAPIDSYRLTVTPADGQGRSRAITVPAGRSSALITELEAGRLYDITLVAERGGARSDSLTNQLLPGPEPPSDLVFSEVKENSVMVSWVKPKSDISGFKITYTHSEEGEPFSEWVESNVSSWRLSQLATGSSYEVSLVSTLGLHESHALTDFTMTLPDSPTDPRAVNVTESSALLLWRPALAAVDKYNIIYGPDADSELRVSASGNEVEQRLGDLRPSTTYTVTISSQLGALQSSPSTTTFTTTSTSSGIEALRDLQATKVTPRSATLSWKPPSSVPRSYRLTYEITGEERKELMLDGALTQLELKRLLPGSSYVVKLQDVFGGDVISTRFTTGTLLFPFPSDCSQELLNGISSSSETEIFPLGELGLSLLVYCDMETDGGGWTVFQRRKDGSVDFFRGWKDYVRGFGDPTGEFWIGLDALNNLTSVTKMSLWVELRDGGEAAYAHYSQFAVGGRSYRLTVGGFSGTAGDSLSYHNQRPFSTRDRDPAPFITRCAMSYRGGWWYKNCHQANLNGLYGVDTQHQGIIWTSWKGKDTSLSFTEMKLRPTTFTPPPRG